MGHDGKVRGAELLKTAFFLHILLQLGSCHSTIYPDISFFGMHFMAVFQKLWN